METKKNSENKENVHLELVLEEFIREQKSQSKCIADLAGAINSLSDRCNNIEEELKKSKPISVSANMQPIQEILKKSISDIELIVSNQQEKPVIKKFQMLLFPEQDTKLFYKIVFGRWLLWLTTMLFLTNLLKFSIHWSDNQKEIKFRLMENEHFKQAWFRLYSLPNKHLRRLMDTTYYKSEVGD
jgi:hypothetical protein